MGLKCASSPFLRAAAVCVSMLVAASLTGCALNSTVLPDATVPHTALQGRVHGGQAPVVGSRIFLYAAGTTGYRGASISRLSGVGFATTDASGTFSITAQNICQASDQVYALAVGGNPGLAAGTNNAALVLMAALGPCSAQTPSTFITINEATTVAAAFSLAQFMADETHVGTSAGNLTGMSSAFATATNLVSSSTGFAPATTPAGNGTIPQAEIDSLANSLAACANTDGTGAPCTSLFTAATPSGGSAPTNLTQAALAIAQNPANNAAAIFLVGVGVGAPFQPTLTAAPADWSICVSYTAKLHQPSSVAVDSLGNVWVSDANSLNKLAPTGDVLVASRTGGGMSLPIAIAVDLADNVWTANELNNTISGFTAGGTALSATGFGGGGLTNPIGISIDGAGKIWIANLNAQSLSKFNPDGTAISPAAGFTGGSTFDTRLSYPVDVAIDGNGFAWALIYDATLTRMSSDGSATAHFYAPGQNPGQNVIDAGNNIWTSAQNRISKVAAGGATFVTYVWPTDFNNISVGGLSIDGNSDAWVGTGGSTTIQRMRGTTGAVSYFTINGTVNTGITATAPDASGNLWMADKPENVVLEEVGVATPTATPLAVAIKNGRLGARP